MGFGAKLKEILMQKEKSIAWLSEQTGIPKNSLYTITKRDNTIPRLETIQKIAEVLDVPTASLILDDDTLNKYIEERRNTYYANNISNINSSNVVQSSNSVAVNGNISNQKDLFNLSEEEREILNIYRSLNIRDKAKFLNAIIEINDEKN